MRHSRRPRRTASEPAPTVTCSDWYLTSGEPRWTRVANVQVRQSFGTPARPARRSAARASWRRMTAPWHGHRSSRTSLRPCGPWQPGRPADLRPHRRHRRVRHARGRRQGEGAQGGRPPGDRLRRGRTGLPDARADRRGGRRPPARTRATTATPPPAGLPELREAIADKTLRDSGYAGRRRPGARHQRRQAGRLPGVRRPCSTPATRCCCPRRTGRPTRRRSRWPAASPVPVVDRRVQPTTWSRSSSSRRPARRAPRCCCSARRPTRPAPCTRREQVEAIGRWARGARHLGGHRRDLRAPGLRRRRGAVDAGAGAGARRPLRRAERRREDLRDDRLAGRLDDRPAGRDQGRRPTCSRT